MKRVKRINKLIFSVASILLCTMCAVGAEYIENVNYNYKTERVELNGRDFSASDEGSVATVIVLKGSEKQELSALSETNVEKQEQTVIENGEFSFEFKLHAPEDGMVYTAYVTAGKSKSSSSFTYSDDIEGVYDDVIADLSAISVENSAVLGLDDTVYGAIENTSNIGTIISSADKNAIEELAETDKLAAVELLKDTIEQAAYIQALNEGKIDEVVTGTSFNDPALLGLDSLNTTAYKLYQNNINDTGVAQVLANIQKRGLTSVENFLDVFTYEVTAAAITNNTTSGDGHIADILADNNVRNKFDLSNYKGDTLISAINILLLKNTDWSKDNVQAILDTELEESGKDPEKGNGSSGSVSIGGAPGTYSQSYSASGNSTSATVFTDLGDVEWAADAIEGLAAAGVVSGRGNGIYAPLDSVTRAEFLQMLVKALDIVVENPACSFPDVIEGEWYYNAVATGTAFGLASGYDNGYFGTTDLITRQDAAVMLNNAIVKSGKELTIINDGIDFADKAEISDYAEDDVEILVKAGILSGANGNFMPKSNCSRAEAAVMISKIISAVKVEG